MSPPHPQPLQEAAGCPGVAGVHQGQEEMLQQAVHSRSRKQRLRGRRTARGRQLLREADITPSLHCLLLALSSTRSPTERDMGEAASSLAHGSSKDSHPTSQLQAVLVQQLCECSNAANYWGAKGGTFALCSQKG